MHVGALVKLQFSEHWDLVSAVGSDWFPGTISKIAPDHDSALIALESPIDYVGQGATLLLATPRYKKHSLTPEMESCICGFVAVDNSMVARFADIEPRKITSWFQAIGTLEVANT
jgi:hypothetical protein